MKKNKLCTLIFSTIMFLSIGNVNAQTDPGTANLTHQWTFDTGTANDNAGAAHGTLMGGATITNKTLNVTTGGYLSLPAGAIAINSYSAITTEIWFKSVPGGNTGYTILSYFGTTIGALGYNYYSTSAARGDNMSRSCISSAYYNTETSVNGPEYDDGKLHQFISELTDMQISFYIDGVFIGSAINTTPISSISNDFAYLCKGGYTADRTWLGNINKFSIYNKILTSDEVLYLYQKGAELQAVIIPSATSLAFDSKYSADSLTISSENLSSDIIITAPAGIRVTPSVIASNTSDVSVTVVYDTTKTVNGNIKLTSGSTFTNVPVKSAIDSKCSSPLYSGAKNLLGDNRSGMSSLTTFGGWGTRTVSTIITDSANVYCGAASIKIGDGVSSGSGSLDVDMANILQPNTEYLAKVMIKTTGGTFQLGVETDHIVEKAIDTQGEWRPLELSFTTGPTLGSGPVMYINNYKCTGATAYVDNCELYVLSKPKISTSIQSLTFDSINTSTIFTVSGYNLTDSIRIKAPAGITITPKVLAPTGGSVLATYSGSSSFNDSITLTSDSCVKKIPVLAYIGFRLNNYLTHLWTFDDGTANDNAGNANGILKGTAIIRNNALETGQSGYLEFPGDSIKISSYHELSMEVWFKSVYKANNFYTMICYFGDVTPYTGTVAGYTHVGSDGCFIATSRADNISRAAISCGTLPDPWTGESWVNSTEYNDSLTHHMVSTINDSTITFYIDGALIGSSVLAEKNKIRNLSNNYAFLAQSGYVGFDSIWNGTIHKFSLYNKALNLNEVQYLYQLGAETNLVVTNLNKTSNTQKNNSYFQDSKLISEIYLKKSQNVDFILYDLRGQLINKENAFFEAGNNVKVINVNLPKGLYVVKLITAEGTVEQKIIKR